MATRAIIAIAAIFSSSSIVNRIDEITVAILLYASINFSYIAIASWFTIFTIGSIFTINTIAAVINISYRGSTGNRQASWHRHSGTVVLKKGFYGAVFARSALFTVRSVLAIFTGDTLFARFAFITLIALCAIRSVGTVFAHFTLFAFNTRFTFFTVVNLCHQGIATKDLYTGIVLERFCRTHHRCIRFPFLDLRCHYPRLVDTSVNGVFAGNVIFLPL